MATVAEIRQKIESLPADRRSEIFNKYGASVDSILVTMSANPNWEGMLCYDLGLPTEAERVARATFDASWYAKAAFSATLAVGIPSLIIAVIPLLK
jgi:hypothetical protein